ncbi:hypothetical protein CAEBREN_07121 [Caenorhabditis brenneri]|uniref:Uncharacterized protein n=1 Tax=Caenorhabditis brenneri TaxID=135651 RepID=G0NKE8_CAEBE|nr:hypothetical protein CAEBREN_07121 [Caenorhabditis brenneri]
MEQLEVLGMTSGWNDIEDTMDNATRFRRFLDVFRMYKPQHNIGLSEKETATVQLHLFLQKEENGVNDTPDGEPPIT